jgi:hypothetical protein
MFIRVGTNTVTFEKHWHMYEDQPMWAPGIEWDWMDFQVSEGSRLSLLTYSNPTDRYWELFGPGEEMTLAARWDRIQDRADDEYVGVWHVEYL